MSAELNLADLGFPLILKSEIEGKLKELDVYIDEELPDYILVLLANKKSQQQMCKDLRLFFGSLTETFVEWVHNRMKELKTNQIEIKEVNNSKKKEADETNSEVKTKQNRRSSLSSEKKPDSNPPPLNKKSPTLSSPKGRKSESAVKDQSASLGKRKSRSPESESKPRKSRIYQEVTDYLTSNRRRFKTNDAPNHQVSTSHLNEINTIRSPEKKSNPPDTKTFSKRPSTRTTIQPFRTEMVTPPPTRSFESGRNKSVSPVRDARARERVRGREREISGEKERKEERRFRSRSTPLSPVLSRKPIEELPRRNKNQVRLRYFNTKAKSPSPPLHTQPQLSSVVKIKSSNRVVRGVRNLGNKDEQKGSIRLVHKALSEAAASTARSSHPNLGSSKKRKPVMSRLGPQVDNSSLIREVCISPEKKRNNLVPAEYSNRSVSSKKTKYSDRQTDSSQGINQINAQFDLIKIPRAESTCSISDDDLFPPRENSPERKVQANNISRSAHVHESNLFDSEEVLPTDSVILHKRKVLPLKPNKPKFFVTLDGAQQHYSRQVMSTGSNLYLKEKSASIGKIDIKHRLGNKPVESPEELTTLVYNPPDISPLSETLKATTLKPKTSTPTSKPTDPLTERCKFWPNCKLGDKCDFHHPSLPCKNFPYCKFNQKCHYVHPDCKFDPYCTKPDCPFLHRHPRNSFPNHLKSTFSYTPDNKSSFPTRSQLTWTPGQKISTPKEKEDDATRHISERKFALEEVQTVLIPKNET